jgi:hypothetical protein
MRQHPGCESLKGIHQSRFSDPVLSASLAGAEFAGIFDELRVDAVRTVESTEPHSSPYSARGISVSPDTPAVSVAATGAGSSRRR